MGAIAERPRQRVGRGSESAVQGQASKVIAAVQAIAGGAMSKTEATAAYGVGRNALTPTRLAELSERVPALRRATDMWSITIPGNGGRVSLREAMSAMVESATKEIATLGKAMGSITRDERQRLKLALGAISMAKSLGLWQDPEGAAPAELANTLRDVETREMSADHYLQRAESLTVRPQSEVESPAPPSEQVSEST